jgi:hypothetical protein
LTVKLCLAQDPDADQLLSENPFALLVGMVLDQQIPLEVPFRGPKKIADRMAAADGSQRIALDQQVPMDQRGGQREALRLSDWTGHPDAATP